ncbi:uncharacterized protein [Diadema setosum]|uniref:uncharacterized protein n=1 Tax=Diadema setosum TaxID=31175 RepID=UPI003B3A7E2D
MASKHIIEECVDKSQSSQNQCTFQSPSNATSIILTCVLSASKPDVSMMWTDESGNRLKSVDSQQTISVDRYEGFEKIAVSAKQAKEQTFVCIATGDSVNGTSIKKITLLPVSGKRDNVGLIIGQVIIGVLAAVAIPYLVYNIRKCRQKRDHDYVPQKVSKESPPTIQTTLNSEDESRKWYSVRWADFKLCCRRLKDVSSKHPVVPFALFACYRFGLAVYFFAFFIISVVYKEEELGPKFVIYLPFWTYTSSTCYVFLACFNVVMDLNRSRTNAAYEGTVIQGNSEN